MLSVEPIAVAILAKAPLPGLAKTRLIPALGREGAALLQARLIARTLATACAAAIGPVSLWAAPEESHFHELAIGSDCPALEPQHLRDAADALRDGCDAAVIPAEDGGYVLIGLRQPRPDLFADMPWGTGTVMAETRRRAAELGLAVRELAPLWDLDLPADLDRLREAGLAEL